MPLPLVWHRCMTHAHSPTEARLRDLRGAPIHPEDSPTLTERPPLVTPPTTSSPSALPPPCLAFLPARPPSRVPALERRVLCHTRLGDPWRCLRHQVYHRDSCFITGGAPKSGPREPARPHVRAVRAQTLTPTVTPTPTLAQAMPPSAPSGGPRAFSLSLLSALPTDAPRDPSRTTPPCREAICLCSQGQRMPSAMTALASWQAPRPLFFV